jgi:hypothetical protein
MFRSKEKRLEKVEVVESMRPKTARTKNEQKPNLTMAIERNIDNIENLDVEKLDTNESIKAVKLLKQFSEVTEQDILNFQNLKFYYLQVKADHDKLVSNNGVLLQQIEMLRDENKTIREENEQLKANHVKKRIDKGDSKKCTIM